MGFVRCCDHARVNSLHKVGLEKPLRIPHSPLHKTSLVNLVLEDQHQSWHYIMQASCMHMLKNYLDPHVNMHCYLDKRTCHEQIVEMPTKSLVFT